MNNFYRTASSGALFARQRNRNVDQEVHQSRSRSSRRRLSERVQQQNTKSSSHQRPASSSTFQKLLLSILIITASLLSLDVVYHNSFLSSLSSRPGWNQYPRTDPHDLPPYQHFEFRIFEFSRDHYVVSRDIKFLRFPSNNGHDIAEIKAEFETLVELFGNTDLHQKTELALEAYYSYKVIDGRNRESQFRKMETALEKANLYALQTLEKAKMVREVVRRVEVLNEPSMMNALGYSIIWKICHHFRNIYDCRILVPGAVLALTASIEQHVGNELVWYTSLRRALDASVRADEEVKSGESNTEKQNKGDEKKRWFPFFQL